MASALVAVESRNTGTPMPMLCIYSTTMDVAIVLARSLEYLGRRDFLPFPGSPSEIPDSNSHHPVLPIVN